MADPAAEKLSSMITGYWVSQIVGTLAGLDMPDRLANGPRSAADLANEIGCSSQATYRFLRAAASIDLVSATSDGRFALTPLGEMLRSDVPGSMRDTAVALTAPGHWLPWGRLADAVRSGRRQSQTALGQELFEYYAAHPGEGDVFIRAMWSLSTAVADEVAAAIDAADGEHVVDVGGGSGALIAALLKRNPSLQGSILELAHVVPRARAALATLGLSSRCEVVEGDFFTEVPSADIHILKYIIHDWGDEQSVRILLNCSRALRQNGRVILVERMLPEDGRPSTTPLADLNMLVLLSGRERTAAEYAALLEAAHLHLDRVIAIPPALQLIEASPNLSDRASRRI